MKTPSFGMKQSDDKDYNGLPMGSVAAHVRKNDKYTEATIIRNQRTMSDDQQSL